MDSAHQVIVAAGATNQTSGKEQVAAMLQETIDNVGAVPREVSADAGYYSAKAVEDLRALGVDPYVAPDQTRHGRGYHPRPEVAYPSGCPPGTGCGAGYRRRWVDNVTRCAWRLWSRYSARSGRAEASGGSCCGVWRRLTESGRRSAPDTTCSSCSGSSAQRSTHTSRYSAPPEPSLLPIAFRLKRQSSDRPLV